MREFYPGRIVNHRYRILRRLGHGGTGRVFLVEDRLIENRRVAFKTLSGTGTALLEASGFRREFETLTRLSSPHLVEVYDYGIVTGEVTPFFTMEFVDGVDLVTAAGRLTEREFCECLAQICRALEYLHLRGLVHGDLKPANILVTWLTAGEPLVKLLDFGFSGRVGGVAVGTTIQYQAPEVLRGQPRTAKSDLYSLGISLYEASTQRLPFVGTNPDQLVEAHLHHRPSEPTEADPKLSRRLWPVLETLLAKDPRERFDSALAVVKKVNETMGLSLDADSTIVIPEQLLGSPFVGRERELAILAEETERLKSGRKTGHRGVLVTGEPGIGKSRLLQEFRYSCQWQGLGFFSADCRPNAGEAYEPLTTLLRQALAAAGIDPRRGQRNLISLCRLAAQEMDLEPVDVLGQLHHSQVTIHLAEVMLRFLRRLAQRSPFILVVDDFQWVNEPTAEGLGYLLRNATGEPFQVLLVYREREVRPPAGGVIGELTARGVPAISLAPLTRGELLKLVEGALGATGFADAFLSRFQTHTRGNPFFALELLRLYVQERVLWREEDRWRVDDILLTDQAPVPDSLQKLVSRRVASVPGAEREVVEALAVLARPASPALLAGVLGTTPGDILVRCGRLAETGLVLRDPERDVVELTHWEIGRVLYALLNPARKRVLHGRAGAVLESLSDKPEVSVVQLARHYLRARDAERGGKYGVEAAELLQRSAANREARELYEQTLALLKPGDARAEVRVRAGLAGVYQFLGEPDQAGECARLGLALAERIGDDQGRLRFHQVLARVSAGAGRFPEADHHLKAAWRLLGEFTPPSHVAAELLEARGESALQQGDFEGALKLLNEALNALGTERENARTAAIYTSMAVAHHRRRQVQYALACLERSMNIRRRIDDREGLSRSLNNKGNIHFLRGEYAQAQTCYEQSLEIKQALGNVEGAATSFFNLGNVHSLRGEHALARRAYENSLQMRRRIGDRLGELSSLVALANACNQTGDYPTALEAARECLALEKELRRGPSPAPLLELTGALVELGRTQAAEEAVRKAVRLAERGTNARDQALSYLQSAKVYSAQGDLTSADEWLAKAREPAESVARGQTESQCLHAVLLECARVALHRGDTRKADRLLRRAEQTGAAGTDSGASPDFLQLKAAALPASEAPTALATFEQAAEVAQRTGTVETLWRAQWGAARIYQQQRRYASALRCYETALSALHRVCVRLSDDRQVRDYLEGPERRALLQSLDRFSQALEEAVREGELVARP